MVVHEAVVLCEIASCTASPIPDDENLDGGFRYLWRAEETLPQAIKRAVANLTTYEILLDPFQRILAEASRTWRGTTRSLHSTLQGHLSVGRQSKGGSPGVGRQGIEP